LEELEVLDRCLVDSVSEVEDVTLPIEQPNTFAFLSQMGILLRNSKKVSLRFLGY
jgi:hypothetical protein